MIESRTERVVQLGLGLAAFLAVSVFLWPDEVESLDRGLGYTAVTAFVIWLVSEVRPLLRSNPHPHDVAFLRALRKNVPLDSVRYLQQQDFGASYNNGRLDCFWKVDFDAQAKGYEPFDRHLRKRFSQFTQSLKEFSNLLASNGGPINASGRLSTIVPDIERVTDEFSPKTCELVRDANIKADEVVRTFDALMRAGKKRVPVAFVDPL